jgi:hypothetical protein
MGDDNVRYLSLDELRFLAKMARDEAATRAIEPVEIPPVHLAILEPLTKRELLRCVRAANMDRRHHVHSRHPREEDGARCDHWVEVILKALVERSGGKAIHVVRSAASTAASKYSAHVTEGHIPPAESEEEYLRGLVERVLRESA